MLRHAAQLLPPSFRLQDRLMCCFYDTCLSCFLPFSFHSVSIKSWFWLFIITFNKPDLVAAFSSLRLLLYVICSVKSVCSVTVDLKKKWSLALHKGLISFAWMFLPPLAFFQFPAAPTGSFLSSLSPDFSFPGSHGLGFSSRSMIHTPSRSMAVSNDVPGPNTPRELRFTMDKKLNQHSENCHFDLVQMGGLGCFTLWESSLRDSFCSALDWGSLCSWSRVPTDPIPHPSDPELFKLGFKPGSEPSARDQPGVLRRLHTLQGVNTDGSAEQSANFNPVLVFMFYMGRLS